MTSSISQKMTISNLEWFHPFKFEVCTAVDLQAPRANTTRRLPIIESRLAAWRDARPHSHTHATIISTEERNVKNKQHLSLGGGDGTGRCEASDANKKNRPKQNGADPNAMSQTFAFTDLRPSLRTNKNQLRRTIGRCKLRRLQKRDSASRHTRFIILMFSVLPLIDII